MGKENHYGKREKYEHVNHPPHYQGRIECIDYVEDKLTKEEYIGFLKGSILKYISRLGKKENDLDDSRKAMWYLERLTQIYSKEPNTSSITTTPTDDGIVINGNTESPHYGAVKSKSSYEKYLKEHGREANWQKFWEESY